MIWRSNIASLLSLGVWDEPCARQPCMYLPSTTMCDHNRVTKINAATSALTFAMLSHEGPPLNFLRWFVAVSWSTGGTASNSIAFQPGWPEWPRPNSILHDGKTATAEISMHHVTMSMLTLIVVPRLCVVEWMTYGTAVEYRFATLCLHISCRYNQIASGKLCVKRILSVYVKTGLIAWVAILPHE